MPKRVRHDNVTLYEKNSIFVTIKLDIMLKAEKRGKLYVVSTHIGNIEDVTIRAKEVLKLCDIVVCEELKVGSVLLKKLQINKKLLILNEQNESEVVLELIHTIKEDDKKISLISDCGTPVFADPGFQLVKTALLSDIDVIVVPGATSLMTALVRSGMDLNQFLYAGFLSRKREERIEQLISLSKEPRTVVIYDTPYRLLPVLEDASKVMPNRNIYIGMNLTMPFETHHYGTFAELFNKFEKEKTKAEFVICFEGNDNSELSMRFAPKKEDIIKIIPRKDTKFKTKNNFRKQQPPKFRKRDRKMK
ncbi:MAG: 16S rRNA (cytidine(1402)-2'-O)-methyltransferase [Bacteroidetes bacterium]|nr:16S rRNA (cytidine(1402)-2'-O)-methyltransferase [Bacteroidota bacterium]